MSRLFYILVGMQDGTIIRMRAFLVREEGRKESILGRTIVIYKVAQRLINKYTLFLGNTVRRTNNANGVQSGLCRTGKKGEDIVLNPQECGFQSHCGVPDGPGCKRRLPSPPQGCSDDHMMDWLYTAGELVLCLILTLLS